MTKAKENPEIAFIVIGFSMFVSGIIFYIVGLGLSIGITFFGGGIVFLMIGLGQREQRKKRDSSQSHINS